MMMQQGLLIVFAAYTDWTVVSVWRCAVTYDPHWGLIARCLTVAWACNSVMAVMFLQLELLTSCIDS